jgi:hypothetical protein
MCCKIVKRLTVIRPGEYSNKPSVKFRAHKLFVALPGNMRQFIYRRVRTHTCARPKRIAGAPAGSVFKHTKYITVTAVPLHFSTEALPPGAILLYCHTFPFPVYYRAIFQYVRVSWLSALAT